MNRIVVKDKPFKKFRFTVDVKKIIFIFARFINVKS
jgi:hypothetical protein